MPYNVLYIASRWCDALPEHGISMDGLWQIKKTLEATNKAKCCWFSFDAHYAKHKKPGDKALIKLCKEKKFDFIILDWMNGLRIPHEHGNETIDGRSFFNLSSNHEFFSWLNPTYKTLDILSHKMNIPMIGFAWDSITNDYIKKCEELESYLKFHVVVDSSILLYIVKDPQHYLTLWGPRDPKLYYNPGESAKNIPISYLGRLFKPNADRGPTIKYLIDHGIDVFHAGGQREKTKVSMEEYASLMRRSKIIINLPKSTSGISQLNGKTIEATLSGAMLLEEMNLETLRLLIPMVDFVPFYGLNDLYVKTAYFMHHEDQRREIAQRGCEKMTKYYNNEVFWGTIFNELGLQVK